MEALSKSYKVPRRQVYCATFLGCVRETIWCLFLLPVGMKLGLIGGLPRRLMIPGDEGDGSGTGG